MQYEAVIRQIKRQRQQLGLTQKQLAQMAQLSSNHYARIERNLVRARASTLRRIMEAVNLPLSWLSQDGDLADELIEFFSHFSPEEQERLLGCLREFAKLFKNVELDG